MAHFLSAFDIAPAGNYGGLRYQSLRSKHFLVSELSSGPRLGKDLFPAASNLGISKKTLYRAQTELNIISEQVLRP